MDKPILAVFDSEERYAYGFMEFISNKSNLPFQVHVFTEPERFFAYSKQEEIECLLISENVYQREVEALNIPHIIILSESSDCLNKSLLHIHKYQSCEAIFREVMAYYMKEAGHVMSCVRTNTEKMKIIGIYTPVGRCLQTTFSFALGQILSKKAKVLYMNFERYSGLEALLKRSFQYDISDLVYYFQCAKEKLSLRLSSIVENVHGLDFVPPVQLYQSILGVHGQQWIELFAEIEKCSDYEYLILDLTDGVADLWDILRSCTHVYTITRGDGVSLAKMDQYERGLRTMEYEDVLASYKDMDLNVIGADASREFLDALAGVTEPEAKRKIIGRLFVETFDKYARAIENARWLAQGTIYPDVIESAGIEGIASKIKSHHNVGGLPEKMNLKIVEPLRALFKDEVRRVGRALGIKEELVGRHPFPGPSLAIRIIGDITEEKLNVLREADDIFIKGLREYDCTALHLPSASDPRIEATNLYDAIWQAGVIFLPIKSVGVMGDERTYENPVALRAVVSTDAMTADWFHFPYDFLAQVSNDIINKVKGVNRVVYDISSKPPATIEWE